MHVRTRCSNHIREPWHSLYRPPWLSSSYKPKKSAREVILASATNTEQVPNNFFLGCRLMMPRAARSEPTRKMGMGRWQARLEFVLLLYILLQNTKIPNIVFLLGEDKEQRLPLYIDPRIPAEHIAPVPLPSPLGVHNRFEHPDFKYGG